MKSRKVRWRVWSLMALACVPAALHWPLIRDAMEFTSQGAWSTPSLSLLTRIYLPGKSNLMMCLLALVLIALVWLRDRNTPAVPGEIVAAWVMTILAPVIGLLTAFAISGMIAERYVLFWHGGVIAALLYGAARLSRQEARVGVLLLGLTASLFVRIEVREVRRAGRERSQMDKALSEADELLQRYPTMPLVVTDAFLAYPMYYYAPRSTRERIVYVADGELQPPGSPHYSIDHVLPFIYLRGFPFPVRGVDFYRAAKPFLLAHAELWGGAAMIRIREHGCALTPAGVWNGQTLYLVERCN
jgi:hypothetical protein